MGERVIYQRTESEGTILHTSYSGYDWTYLQKAHRILHQIYYMQNIYNLKQEEKKDKESWLQTGKNENYTGSNHIINSGKKFPILVS